MTVFPPLRPSTEPIYFHRTPHRAAKGFWEDTQRVCSPQETLNRIRPYFAQAGITRLATLTHLDRIGIPTTLALRPNGASLSNGAGKGFTQEAALASAAMEALEIYHAETVCLPIVTLPYEQLANHCPVIPLEQLPLTRYALFHPSQVEQWIMGWDLVSQQEVAVPLLLVTLHLSPSTLSGALMSFQMGSNGLASGNHLLEALCAGLLEVIERDAITCHRVAWALGRPAWRRVRLDTVTDPRVQGLLSRFEEAQVQTLLFDCRVDTDVPTYMALLYDQRQRHIGLHQGYGAHLDPAVAMIRALTEAAQSRLIFIAGSRDDLLQRQYRLIPTRDDHATIGAYESIPATVSAATLPSEGTPTFEGDLHLLLTKLQRVGLSQVIALDLTKPEMGVPVVRVVVPGLEGYMLGHYTPGRRAHLFLERHQP